MMVDDFTQMIKRLQKKIEYDEEKKYSKVVINEYRNPIHFGVLDHPDTIGQIKGPCGDSMKFCLNIEKGVIKEACFWTDGCGATIASGNMLIKMFIGKPLSDAINLTSEQLLDALHGLPKEHMHCTVLAVNTLQASIKNYQIKNK
jgi:nitrogen fixation protein NifU and related proteins